MQLARGVGGGWVATVKVPGLVIPKECKRWHKHTDSAEISRVGNTYKTNVIGIYKKPWKTVYLLSKVMSFTT